MGDSYTRCPEPEVLAAYVDRGLSLAERARVDRHLASCPQCLALVAGVVRTVADVPESTPHAEPAVEIASRAATRRTLVGVLAAAAAVVTVLFTPSLVRPWLDRDTGLVNLVGVSEQRSVLGRLTGGFPHAPLGAPSAGGQGGRAAETDRILLTAAKIRESFGERETPSRLNDLGRSQLLAGQFDAAADALLAASREQPANARYLNDVATVQLERARLGLRPDDLPRALASADRARRIDPSLTEAWFNRALAMTALSLTADAKRAWADYLERDADSPWADEARARLAELSRPTAAAAWLAIEPQLRGDIDVTLADAAVRTQMTEARAVLENELLPAWAAAVEAGRDGAVELARVRAMAEAFGRVAGDRIYIDTVAAIERAQARGSGAVRALAVAHAGYAQAARAFAEDRFPAAAASFAAALPQLHAAYSPFAVRARIELAAINFVTGQTGTALSAFAASGTEARERRYLFAAGRSTWFLGLIAFGQGRIGEAQAAYEDTLATFAQMGDVEQAAGAHNLLASLHGYLGDERQAWEHRAAALPVLTISRSQRLHYGVLVGAAAAVRRQNPEASLAFQDAVVDNAKTAGRLAPIVDSLSARAALLSELGQDKAAQNDLAAARLALAAVPAAAVNLRIEEPILAAESNVFRRTDPARAIAAAEAAIERVGQRGDRLRVAQLALQLAKANIVLGNLVAADAALERGIQAFEEERSSLSDEGQVSTLDESWQLFDTAVQFAIRNKDYPRAFAMSERARARTLAEKNRAPVNHTLSDIERSIPVGEAIVALNQFEDELAVWVIGHERTTVVMRPLTRRDAQRLVSRQLDEIRLEAVVPGAGADLFREILRPVAGDLAGVSRLSFVPDATYQDVSFAALWDASKGRFLVEQMTVTMASNVAGAAAGRASPPPTGQTDSLIFGGPGALAASEALAVAAAYNQPAVLTGSAATRSRFIADAPSHAIVHLSAQTRPNAAYPLLSRLMLSDEPGVRYSGALLGRDLASRALPRTRVVVIDDVTANESMSREGSLGLARAFIAAGVPAVVGTLPGANEAATRELMVGFHRLMSSGITADEALNTLQRNVLQSNGRRLGAWSALVLYGSDR
ncbi:MAG: CHAT domain-containing protein [Acidobacteriota bacterium]|nr:CHAT domain-containing protein [Acidobacteriota bacterium]